MEDEGRGTRYEERKGLILLVVRTANREHLHTSSYIQCAASNCTLCAAPGTEMMPTLASNLRVAFAFRLGTNGTGNRRGELRELGLGLGLGLEAGKKAPVRRLPRSRYSSSVPEEGQKECTSSILERGQLKPGRAGP